jgi:hypothetical protein
MQETHLTYLGEQLYRLQVTNNDTISNNIKIIRASHKINIYFYHLIRI